MCLNAKFRSQVSLRVELNQWSRSRPIDNLQPIRAIEIRSRVGKTSENRTNQASQIARIAPIQSRCSRLHQAEAAGTVVARNRTKIPGVPPEKATNRKTSAT